ncbi:SpoIID/LytB domain-containing protein [Candidatus Synechococcus calcipolaris G9]|uniref:SpoIID/LytB domain-containing protein n=1 Tax=Candidatus Synechococcus calcipolaris G9 TaxID=1497997 RepID=A0ABT6EYQ8_9SYNE|nr:SpoIID/LytB domain-containing protein [Candidatus Synechococcus calcipolaris]MDG2990441.1 SpoIID/LytB domain-containing protein [Candidatus Synechococcus calcipolaris G9]
MQLPVLHLSQHLSQASPRHRLLLGLGLGIPLVVLVGLMIKGSTPAQTLDQPQAISQEGPLPDPMLPSDRLSGDRPTGMIQALTSGAEISLLERSANRRNPRPLLNGKDPLLARVSPTPSSTTQVNRSPAALPTTPGPAASPLAALPAPPRTLQSIPPSQGPAPHVRVAISRGQTSLGVGASTTASLSSDQGQSLGSLAPGQAASVQLRDGHLLWNGQALARSLWITPQSGGLTYVDGRWYRGKVRLVAESSSITAVNQVDLEQYLVSVVGAEVYPSWPMDTLKAQAIAARSYALAQMFSPANRFFDLGNDERWQVYKGTESEWNTSQQAVEATRGIVLTKSGRVLVSMYAATDDIVRDVFGGRGMSQTGAYELAKQGFSYLDILATYYPGAGLSQVQLQ